MKDLIASSNWVTLQSYPRFSGMEAETLLHANIFQECFLVEFDIAERQLLALADAVPAEKFSWRPTASTPSISEMFVHIAAGNFFILETIGLSASQQTDKNLPDPELIWQGPRNNRTSIHDKHYVVELLKLSLDAVRISLRDTEPAQQEYRIIRRAYMRLLARCHELMGQVIAYVRTIGIGLPWDDATDVCRPVANGYLH